MGAVWFRSERTNGNPAETSSRSRQQDLVIVAKGLCQLARQAVPCRRYQYLHLRSPPLVRLSAVYRRPTNIKPRSGRVPTRPGEGKTPVSGLCTPNQPHLVGRGCYFSGPKYYPGPQCHCYENSPGSPHIVLPAKAGIHGAGGRGRVRLTCTTPNRPATPHFHHLVRPSQGHSDSERSRGI